LRLCVSGSAPLPADLFAQIAERSGQSILERYGMTETGMNLSNPYDGERRPGTVGFPLPGVSAKLDASTDEILLQGPNVFGGYWDRPEANAECFEGGWFHSGDVGALDDDGYFRIVGRRKELIISGGYNVYPREVEDVLRGHPSVVDAAVVGAPHADWGEQVVAFIEGSGGTEEILAYASERLAPYKRPKQIHVVDELPRNALGKVTKEALKEQQETR
jgi:malonyl-CoA/methylmalonyl-CoA synthetase